MFAGVELGAGPGVVGARGQAAFERAARGELAASSSMQRIGGRRRAQAWLRPWGAQGAPHPTRSAAGRGHASRWAGGHASAPAIKYLIIYIYNEQRLQHGTTRHSSGSWASSARGEEGRAATLGSRSKRPPLAAADPPALLLAQHPRALPYSPCAIPFCSYEGTAQLCKTSPARRALMKRWKRAVCRACATSSAQYLNSTCGTARGGVRWGVGVGSGRGGTGGAAAAEGHRRWAGRWGCLPGNGTGARRAGRPLPRPAASPLLRGPGQAPAPLFRLHCKCTLP